MEVTMDSLVEISNAIYSSLKEKAIEVKECVVLINGHEFSKTLVNDNGEFIGEKYRKFLWLKIEKDDYSYYKQALKMKC
jgi:hypothetical protein